VTDRVLVLGDAVLDVRVVPEEPARPGGDVPARIELLPGGQGANVAVRLARRGVAVTLVTALAEDRAGDLLRDVLTAEEVDLRAVAVPRTGTVVVVAGAVGERTMLSQRSAFADLVDVGSLPPADWTVVSGYLLVEPAASSMAAALAGRPGHRALLGCAVPDGLVQAWRAAAAALAPTLVLANREEAERLIPDAAPGVVVTSPDGASLRVGKIEVRAVAERRAVEDTTGAGDALAAALLADLRRTPWPPGAPVMQAALDAAVASAGTVAGVAGAQGRVDGERGIGVPA
jgi:sugar/nucleoside kinase (ribokinase family)